MMTGALDLTKNKDYGIAKDSNLTETEWEHAGENPEEKVEQEGNANE